MFIQEKYLIKEDGGELSGTKLKCKYCGREFMVPNNELTITVNDVCENENCRTSYEKDCMAAKLEESKNASSDIKAALGN